MSVKMMNRSEVEAAVRAWAKGVYACEAGVELLIRVGKAIYPGAPWISWGRFDDWDRLVVPTAAIDTEVLLEQAGAWSGGERRLVRIAVGLIDSQYRVPLEDAVTGLDRELVELVLAAIAHASGSHEHSGIHYDEDGRPTGFFQHESLYPWPASAEEPYRGDD